LSWRVHLGATWYDARFESRVRCWGAGSKIRRKYFVQFNVLSVRICQLAARPQAEAFECGLIEDAPANRLTNAFYFRTPFVQPLASI
jgi:hypothetical protein